MKPSEPGPQAAGNGPESGPLRIPLGLDVTHARQFHVRGDVRAALDLPGELFSMSGTIMEADLKVLGRLSGWLGPDGATTAELFAAMASHELLHLLLLEQRATGTWAVERLAGALEDESGSLEDMLSTFRTEFPPGSAADDRQPALVALEEVLLLQLHNRNQAMRGLWPLLHDTELRQHGSYETLGRLLTRAAGAVPPVDGQDASLLQVLRRLLQPQLQSPDSLTGQLEALREAFGTGRLGPHEALIQRVLLTTDMLREEQAPRFEGVPGPAAAAPRFSGELLDNTGSLHSASDEDWMGSVVMMAKSCLVWLDQLSGRHGRSITQLDDIPDVELAALAGAGFNALWLIGIWQRSRASRQIKQRRGQPDAEASAYAVHDYVIDPGLGGEEALVRLREHAGRYGLRLVSDMVPNHTGLDSRWVTEHPDWFIQLAEPPFPAYSFTGPELAPDQRVGIRLEDHYWDGSDAAVVFERTDHDTGERRYLYHGNDGTGLPWNDTAQLDYLKPEVRVAVIDTMVAVAHRFPIIRFDAAMTLVRRHIQRLWYPPPGEGGAIASRALHGSMSAEEFARRMPAEFWLEATGRLEREAPGTLLLAEAFWMLEGYFVQNLGMHRVYNSAFMHMLRDEANAEFRNLLRETLQRDALVLGRLVNFMNNPDEDSAAEQFGTGDKYFGVCTLLATLPGLPMFGHGQLEGLQEKYGMEFRSARLDEAPDEQVVARHEAEIFPLLRRRHDFAAAGSFELFDFLTGEGVDENVIAFSNRAGLVAYNNSLQSTRGRLQHSVARGRAGHDEAVAVGLPTALGLRPVPGDHVVWRDQGDGLEYLLAATELQERGLSLQLYGYGKAVLLDFRTLAESALLPLAALAAELGGRGVPDVTAAASSLAWRELKDWLLELLAEEPVPPGNEPRLPDGSHLDPGAVARLLDRAGRLNGLLDDAALARAWELMEPADRILVLCGGLAGLSPVLSPLTPELPAFLHDLPWRHDPDWWGSQSVQDWLAVHVANGETWFVQENFDRLAAIFSVRGALRAGQSAGTELWLALQALQNFSGWHPGRLARALGASSDA